MRGETAAMRVGLLSAVLVPLLLLSGCGPAAPVAEVGVGVAAGASIPICQRTPVDMAVLAATGRDCSVVNLDRGERYCHPKETAPETPPFCTRSLGVANCWEDPSKLPGQPRELADGPRALTPEQERDRTRAGLGLW